MSSLTNINIQSKTMNGLNTINADEITTDNFSATTLGATDLTVSGTITLPLQSINDNALSNNIPRKNAYNSYSATNTFSVSSGDAIQVVKASGGGYIYLNANGIIGFWNGSTSNWSIDSSGNSTLKSLIVYNLTSSTNYFSIGADATIGGYSSIGGAYWTILQTGGAEFQSMESLNGLYALNSQTIDFGTNAPICYGTNITNIPLANITGLSGAYCDLTNNQTVDGVKTFTSNLRANASTGDVFQAFKNSGVGTGHLLFSGAGSFSYYDSTGLVNKWLFEPTGQLSLNNIITTATTGDVFKTNSGTAPYTFIGADGGIGRTDTVAGTGLVWKLLPNGNVQIKGSTGFKSWNFQGASFFYYNLSGNPQIIMNGDSGTVEIPTSLKIGNSTYAPNNGKFTVNWGQNTTSLAPNSVIIGYNAGPLLSASASLNVVIGSQALAVNTNTQQTTAIGYLALNKHTGTGGNSAVGTYAGMELITGTGNNFYGTASGGGLRLNCNYNFAMGASSMGGCSGVLAAYQNYQNTDVTGDTFIFFLTSNAAVDAFQMMSCRGVAGVYFVRVIEADPNNGEIIVSSNVYIDTNSYLYFYNGGTLIVSTTYTGSTATSNTFTIPTGLTGITNLLALVYSYTSTPDRKYCSIISYNSTTGVLVVDTVITMVNGSNMKFWTQDMNSTRGQDITDSVGLGKYSLANIGCGSIENTAFGVASLNGAGGTYNNIEYLLGSSNCGFGAYAGANLSGLSSNNIFIGANSDFLGGPSRVCNEGIAIGSQAYVGASYSCAIGSNARAYTLNSTSIGAYSRANETLGTQATAIGYNALANGEGSLSIGKNAATNNNYSSCVGTTAQAYGLNTSSYGYYSRAISNYATSIGANSTASNLNTTVCGYNSSVSGQTSTGCGSTINCTGESAVAIGSNITLSGNFGIAIGSNITVSAQNGIAIGYLSSATHQSSMALGNNVTTTQTDQILIGASTHVVDIRGGLRIYATGQITMTLGSTFTIKDKYLPYEVYGTLIAAATTLPTTSIYGVYRVKSPTTATVVLTLPVAAVAYNGMTIVIKRAFGSAAGAWNNNAATIVNFVGTLQVGLLTTTQAALTLTCIYDGATYYWNMVNLH